MKMLVAAMAVVAVALVGSSARAQDVGPFQIEVEAGFEIEAEEDRDTTAFVVGGGYAFKSVDPGTGPLNEALFLARVPYAGARLGFSTGEADMGPGLDLKGTLFGIRGVYADENIPVVAELNYMTATTDIDYTGGSGDQVMSSFELEAGYLAMPNLLVGLSLGWAAQEVDIPGMYESEVDTASVGVAGKLVQELGNDTALNVEVAYSTLTIDPGAGSDVDATQLEIGADYYLTQLIGVGLGLEIVDVDEDDADSLTVEIRASWHLNTNFGARLSLGITDYEASGTDNSTVFEISAVGRF